MACIESQTNSTSSRFSPAEPKKYTIIIRCRNCIILSVAVHKIIYAARLVFFNGRTEVHGFNFNLHERKSRNHRGHKINCMQILLQSHFHKRILNIIVYINVQRRQRPGECNIFFPSQRTSRKILRSQTLIILVV